ncbi:MAG: type II toxin-antitoxin system RelE/ParE family toxin [Lachnospiraceae bacterium]|nr:type II toxin-antitoxin system RelE/ParE family toxin [Lachnospiraceae bacterium]
MKRTFIEVASFTEKWLMSGFSDEHLRKIENTLLKNPKAGAVIRGTGGLRKLRIPVNDSGKRGGGRVIYVDIEKKETIYLLQVYTKNEKEDLTIKERKLLRNMISILKEE